MLHLNDGEAVKGLHQSDIADYSPEGLTISFKRAYVERAKQKFIDDPDLSYAAYCADISSECFEGKIDGDYVRFYNPLNDEWIYATFYNSWSETYYELDITRHVLTYLANHL